jgi:two-component system KDP operon response regulator KdpE
MNEPKILIVDDEPQMRKLLEIALGAQQFRVQAAGTGKDALIAVAMHPPDLLILDLGLPDEDGQSVLIKLREWFSKPIIVLSARDNEQEIVRALDNGANDYIAKPFRMGELLARIRSALRSSKAEEPSLLFSFGQITVDPVARTISRSGEWLHLTATEYNLLLLLLKNEGRVLTHQYILKEIWGPVYTTQSQYLRVYIGQLRKKIEQNPDKPRYIITEPGIGYRFSGS